MNDTIILLKNKPNTSGPNTNRAEQKDSLDIKGYVMIVLRGNCCFYIWSKVDIQGVSEYYDLT